MIGKVIVDGFKFGFSLRRMLPYVFLNLLFLYTFCDMLGRIGPIEPTAEVLASVTPLLSLYFFIFFLYSISQPLLIATMLHQVKNFGKKVSIKKSFKFGFSAFLKSFLLSLVLSTIYLLISFIPVIFIFPIVFLLFTLASFYVFPAAILDGKRISESFKKSFLIFKKAPLQTLLIYLIICSVSLVLILISFFPFVFWVGGNLYSISQRTQEIEVLEAYLAKLLLSPTILPFLIIPAFAIAFCTVMNIGMMARLYFALKKKA